MCDTEEFFCCLQHQLPPLASETLGKYKTPKLVSHSSHGLACYISTAVYCENLRHKRGAVAATQALQLRCDALKMELYRKS